MPIYRYICKQCGKEFEKKLSIHEIEQAICCPDGHDHAHRLFSSPSIVFKGSGFYVTDHRKKTAHEQH